jgi:hypothetical protein
MFQIMAKAFITDFGVLMPSLKYANAPGPKLTF